MHGTAQKHKATRYEKRVAQLITTIVRQKTRGWLLGMLRQKQHLYVDPSPALSQCLPELAGMPNPTLHQMMKTKAWHIAKSAIQSFVQSSPQRDASPLTVAVVRELCKDAAINDMRLRMPPAAKDTETPASGPPLTIVQKRARSVSERLSRWERKLKLAKTKIAILKKRQAYYRRKGVV